MQHARPLIQDDDLLIVDGTRGVLIVDPDPACWQEYRLRKTELELERSKLRV
jgi:phosphotransferase system enzyme I (PtsI)